MYAYSTARVISEWNVSEAGQRIQMKTEVESKAIPMDQWQEWDGQPRPGFFHAPDLAAVRKQLLESGRNPKVILRNLKDYGSVRYQCVNCLDGDHGLCVIKEMPKYEVEIKAWLGRLAENGCEVEWVGEGLPSITYKVLLHLLKCDRRTPKHGERQAILAKQGNKCNICHEGFDGAVEWDHVQPLRQLVAGQEQQFQALCGQCHAEKTALEGGNGGARRSLESRFSPRTWKGFVESPKPPTLAWTPNEGNEGQMMELDVKRCRRNALAYSAHEWSVFCCLDNFVPSV
jgi:hypothetical protein